MRLHRWCGLAMAGFIILSALTGSVLAFYHELDAALNPVFYTVPAEPQLLEPIALKNAALSYAGEGARISSLPLRIEAGHPVEFTVQGVEGFDRIYLNPHSGEVVGTRRWGDLSQGLTNLMPFLFKLHSALALPGRLGVLVLGIVALVWAFDCFVGFYLTLPRMSRHSGSGSLRGDGFWQRWKRAWQLRWLQGGLKLQFDLHRAGGLWLWPMLFVFAWSSVGFNLSTEVYRPIMGKLFQLQHPAFDLPTLAEPLVEPKIGWSEALRKARAVLAEQQARHGIEVRFEDRLQYRPGQGVYRYRVNTSRDIQSTYGSTEFYLDGNTGELLGMVFAVGQASGNTITSWLYGLHMGTVFGWPYRIFVSVFGLLVTMITITGVTIWLAKRRARRLAQHAKAQGRSGVADRRERPISYLPSA